MPLDELEQELGHILVIDCLVGLETKFKPRSTATVRDVVEIARANFCYMNAPKNEDKTFELVKAPKGRALLPEAPLPKGNVFYLRFPSERRLRRQRQFEAETAAAIDALPTTDRS